MAFSRGPTVIKDGIVFSIDPASTKSYPGATKVNDLTRYGGTTPEFTPAGTLSGGTTVTIPTTGSTTKVLVLMGLTIVYFSQIITLLHLYPLTLHHQHFQ